MYTFKNFSVKSANRAFNKLPHEYEISFGNDTQLFPYMEDTSSIPTQTYNFVDIASIEALDNDTYIGIVFITHLLSVSLSFIKCDFKEQFMRMSVLSVSLSVPFKTCERLNIKFFRFSLI